MVEAITKDQKKILPCAVLCEGEYGFDDLVLGVPVKLGSDGAEAIIEYALTTEEKAALETSAQAVRELCKQVDLMINKTVLDTDRPHFLFQEGLSGKLLMKT